MSGRLQNESTLWLTHRAGHSVSHLALTVAPSRRAPMALIAAISGGHPRPSLWQYPEGTHGPHCGNIRRALTSPHCSNIRRALTTNSLALIAMTSRGHFLSIFLSDDAAGHSSPVQFYTIVLEVMIPHPLTPTLPTLAYWFYSANPAPVMPSYQERRRW